MSLKQYTKNLHANIYLGSAEKLGLKFEVINERLGYVEIYNGSKSLRVIQSVVSANDSVAGKLARNKYLTNEVLSGNNLPVPSFKLFRIDSSSPDKDNQEKILEYVKSNTPVVIKPTDKAGGRGVFADIRSKEDAMKALDQLIKMNVEYILVEEYISGKDYRILCYKDEIVDVLERIPAFVVGDGKMTIKDLIDEKNRGREKMQASLIKTDEKLKNFIGKKNYSLETIPDKDERIVLRSNCNFSEGGETKRIELSKVHPDNIEMFKMVVKVSYVNLCGIDFISPDITKSYKDVKSAVNEINSCPSMDVHYFANMKMDIAATTKLLTLYFN